jgi:hypothetical protein
MQVKVALMSTPVSTLPATPVRRSVSELIPELEYVTINEGALTELAGDVASETFELPAWRAPVFPDENNSGVTDQDVLDFLFIGNAINFQFRDYETGEKFAAEYNGVEWNGAFGMWACLKREFEENPALLTGEALADLSRADMGRIFQSSNGVEIPMFDERHRILTDVGNRLSQEYQGTFSNLVESAKPKLFADGDGIVDKLTSDFPSYNDSAVVELSNGEPLEVLFWKRAQLAPGMAYGRFQDSSSFELRDPESFTVFVDYNLPNVLRGFDILEYSSRLADRIDTRTMLEPRSREEVELRAATVHAADQLMAKVNSKRDTAIYSPHMDYKLFSLRDEVSTPVHLTKTTAY